MTDKLLLWIILFPALCGTAILLIPGKIRGLKEGLFLAGFAGNLALCLGVWGKDLAYQAHWLGWGLDFTLGQDAFSNLILLSAGAITSLVALHTVVAAQGAPYGKGLFSGMLLTLALVNGVALARNLGLLLFFWEGILVTLFGMILLGGKGAQPTAVKALIIAGATDLCMMLGIGLVGHLAGSLNMGEIRLPIESWGMAAFVLLGIGALSKAGAMPFHTWIPDAAKDAPSPFMAFLPGALEKLLGLYLLGRICLDWFDLQPGSPMSLALMGLGAMTILLAVMMALIQRDFKRLLSYHAVSQVGYMILGMGTGLAIGVAGSLFHMLNNALYKCCLFLTAGAVEKQTGSVNINRLGGLAKKMPYTFGCFLVAGAAIAGFPLTNGFFSKELILDSALESGLIFFLPAVIGAFFTPVSFLKLGHGVFFGPETDITREAEEVPWLMRIPMMLLAGACLALGLGQGQVLKLLEPIIGHALHSHTNWLLVGISSGLLILACVDHWLGYRRTGKGVEAADHYHHAWGLRRVYHWAEAKAFDPYEWGRHILRAYAGISLAINDAISRFYDKTLVGWVQGISWGIRKAHNGSQARYSLWVLGGLLLAAWIFWH